MAWEFLKDTGVSLTDPVVSLWQGFVNLLPGLIIAILILLVGYVVSYVVGHGVKLLLTKIGLEKQIEKAKLTKAIGNIRLSSVMGEITKWYIFIIFIASAVDIVELGVLSSILKRFVLWVPDLIAAALVLIFGLFLAHYVSMKIRQNAEMAGARTLSTVIHVVIVTIVTLIGLEQVGINISILTNTFLIIVAALGLGFAIAVGLSFGLGTKQEAGKALGRIRRYF